MEVKTLSRLPSSFNNDIFDKSQRWIIQFLKLCEKSGVIGQERGWDPLYFLYDNDKDKNILSYSYIKNHSYGEYIFDWAWADLYQRMGISYYPKLIHALPFSPVNIDKLLGPSSHPDGFLAVITAAVSFYRENSNLSSHHWLFTGDFENKALLAQGYFIQKTIQYHWINRWESFDDFLASLKQRKRKQIKKERQRIIDSEIEILCKRGNELSVDERLKMYHLYLSTIEKKFSNAYLGQAFFEMAPDFLAEQLVVFFALLDGEIIAMSSFYQSENTLYGRYWGILAEKEEEHRLLHFELCYYRGMDWCLEHGLSLFEAGAQGEQKLLRGFVPVEILSAHHLKDQRLAPLIESHVRNSNLQVEQQISQLARYLPYRLDETK